MYSGIIITKHLNVWDKICHITYVERNYSQASQINPVSQVKGGFNFI